MVFHGLDHHGNLLAQIFRGVWLFPLGILVYRSGFLPRILGVLLIVACFGYLGGSLTFLLWPAYGPSVSNLAVGLGGLGEGAFMLWLLIMGAKEEPASTRALTFRGETGACLGDTSAALGELPPRRLARCDCRGLNLVAVQGFATSCNVRFRGIAA